MPRPVVLMHGYSDAGVSFGRWREILEKAGRTVKVISYVTLTNEVTVKDIAEGFDRALRSEFAKDEDPEPEFDAIVHSTGMLVIRAWLTTYARRRQRLNALIGLAPASFGSPLATMGRSFLGSIFKGNKAFGPDFLEAGDEVLDALELGSAFTWDLAHRDLIPTDEHKNGFYGPEADTPYVYVFCGTDPYDGLLRRPVNKPGTDGTVRWAGCALHTRKVVLDLARDPARDPEKKRFEVVHGVNVTIPLVPVPGHNHATILSDPSPELREMVLAALGVNTADDFNAWHAKYKAAREAGYEFLIGSNRGGGEWTQFVVHAIDERGDPITDYHLQLHAGDHHEEGHAEFELDVHAYGRDKSYRCYHVDLRKLGDAAARRKLRPTLCVRVIASSGSKLVGYHGFGSEKVDEQMAAKQEDGTWDACLELAMFGDEIDSLFRPFTTTLVEIRLNREPMPLALAMQNRVCWFLPGKGQNSL